MHFGKLVAMVFIDLLITKSSAKTWALWSSKVGIFFVWIPSHQAQSVLSSRDVGVSQGSCPDPILFEIYINDLPQAVQNSTVSFYADDTCLYHQSSDLAQLYETFNSDLKQLNTWLQGEKLSLKLTKTRSMLISYKQRHNVIKSQNKDFELKILENGLQIVQKTKYLMVGETVCSMAQKEHIKGIYTKMARAVSLYLSYKE